jgi:hypothetical protein
MKKGKVEMSAGIRMMPNGYGIIQQEACSAKVADQLQFWKNH